MTNRQRGELIANLLCGGTMFALVAYLAGWGWAFAALAGAMYVRNPQ